MIHPSENFQKLRKAQPLNCPQKTMWPLIFILLFPIFLTNLQEIQWKKVLPTFIIPGNFSGIQESQSVNEWSHYLWQFRCWWFWKFSLRWVRNDEKLKYCLLSISWNFVRKSEKANIKRSGLLFLEILEISTRVGRKLRKLVKYEKEKLVTKYNFLVYWRYWPLEGIEEVIQCLPNPLPPDRASWIRSLLTIELNFSRTLWKHF